MEGSLGGQGVPERTEGALGGQGVPERMEVSWEDRGSLGVQGSLVGTICPGACPLEGGTRKQAIPWAAV